MLSPVSSSTLPSQASPGVHQGRLREGRVGRSASGSSPAMALNHKAPRGSCPGAVWRSWLPRATRRGPGAWRGALCVYVGSGAVLAAPVLCVTLPSRVKSCQTSDPREPQPKLQRGGGKEAERPGAEHGRLLVPGWVCPREPEGQCHFPSHPSHCRQPSCFPDALCLGTLPQNMQYVWVTCPTPTPHPGSP